jgi:hypothetical protein
MVPHPDQDLRPSWGWESLGYDGPPQSTFNLRHRFGPVELDRCNYEEGVTSDKFEFISEMEVLAIAALD